MEALRKKYPKWAHRRDYHAKKKKRRRSRGRRRKKKKISQQDVTTLLLLQLLGQIQGVNAPLGKKHGSNVVTGYGGAVAPDRLAPVRSQDERARVLQGHFDPWRVTRHEVRDETRPSLREIGENEPNQGQYRITARRYGYSTPQIWGSMPS